MVVTSATTRVSTFNAEGCAALAGGTAVALRHASRASSAKRITPLSIATDPTFGRSCGASPLECAHEEEDMADDLWQRSAVELADGIRQKAFSCREAMESVVGRIRARNPALNAIVYDYTDDALAEARRADAEVAAGRGRGPGPQP